MSETFDRSQLDGKDRDQLSQIASALGVKSTSRMRKADLVDAIVGATANGTSTSRSDTNGSERPTPRKIRSTRTADDDIASIAEEQNSLADTGEGGDDMALIRPGRRATTANGRGSEESSNGTETGESDFATTTTIESEPAYERGSGGSGAP